MKRLAKYIRYLRKRIKHDRRAFIAYSVLRFFVMATAVRQLFMGHIESFGICMLTLALLLVPSLMEDHFQIEIPPFFEVTIYLFIFAAEILGEVNHFYVAIPGWDTMLHTINGFLCAAIGFSLVDLLNRHSNQINLSPFYLALTAFCFSMTVGVVWEFIECAADLYLNQDMQKDFIVSSFQSVSLDPTSSQQIVEVRDITKTIIYTATGEYTIDGGYLDIGILDTMKDLFVNFLGAIVFCTCGYIYAMQRGRHQGKRARIAEGFMVRVAIKQGELLDEG